jgi:DNA repair protein RecO (recombination protein O)
MALYKIEAVVLRRRNLGEADRIVTLLSRDRGKVTAVARGARRPRSRLGGRLEPTVRVRALLAEGRSLDIISQVEVIDAHARVRDDLDRVGTASIMLEMTDRAIEDVQPHPEIFCLLVEALALLRNGVSDLAAVWFAARLLTLTGHQPAIDRCAICGKPIRGGAVWSATLGGCVDGACRSRDPRAVAISPGAVALLRFLTAAPHTAVRRMTPGPPQRAELAERLQRFAEARWDVRLRAPEVVGQVATRLAAVPAARSGRR